MSNQYFDVLGRECNARSDGELFAYQAYVDTVCGNYQGFSKDDDNKELIIKELPWEKDVPDFVDAIHAADIRTLYVIDTSTKLLDILAIFSELGFSIKRMGKIRYVFAFGDLEREYNCIEMSVGK